MHGAAAIKDDDRIDAAVLEIDAFAATASVNRTGRRDGVIRKGYQ
jgi:hypothetical protein